MSRVVDVRLEAEGNRQQRVTFQYSKSETSFGFERYFEGTGLQGLADTLGTTLPELGRVVDVKTAKKVVTDSIFDFPLDPVDRIMLIRDSRKILRIVGWGSGGKEKYKLYTRDFEQFATATYNLSGHQLRPTEYVWSGGDIVNLIGPKLTIPDTPSVIDFENKMLKIVRDEFTQELSQNDYGVVEGEVWACKAAIESYILQLSKVGKMFTPY